MSGDWKDDPAADERWCAGLDYGQTQLCAVLGIEPATVSWDAATETLDGDVRAVIGNILTARFGDDWRTPTPPAGDALREALKLGLDLVSHEKGWGTYRRMDSPELYTEAEAFREAALAALHPATTGGGES